MAKNYIKCPECMEKFAYSSIKKHCYRIHDRLCVIICPFCKIRTTSASIYYHYINNHRIRKDPDEEVEEKEKIGEEEEEEEEEKEKSEEKPKQRYEKYISKEKCKKLTYQKNAEQLGYKMYDEQLEYESETEKEEPQKKIKKKKTKEDKKDKEFKKKMIDQHKEKILAMVSPDLKICANISDEEIVKNIDETIGNLIALKKSILEKKTKRVDSLNENNYLYKYTRAVPIDKNLNINLTFQNVINNYIKK